VTSPFDADQLSRCISCGFCLPACPTYNMTVDEASSPRGRITLMRALDAGRLDLDDPTLTEQASHCLGCRACEPVCPAGVEYGQLLEQWRSAQWQGRRRPLIVRALILLVTLRTAHRLAGILRSAARRKAGQADQLMLGCVERTLFPGVSRAALALAPGLAADPDQGCCGALHAHNGEPERGAALARRLGHDLAGTIVTTSGGCAAHLASVIGRERVREFSEYVQDQPFRPVLINGRPARVTLQDSCHLRNGLGVWREPRQLLQGVADYVELPSAATCCGAAGTYSFVRPRESQALVKDKVAEIEAADVDMVIAVNPGCLRQLQRALRRRHSRVRAVHLAEFLALSLKGPHSS
jgi:glycolate oxidase iron-sulfur subunit